jgi:hypothetical protein
MPVLHYTRGICPETGRRIVARGVIGVGRLATGVIAIGHASFGLVAIGQLAIGVLFGLGQAATGAVALGQLAIALVFGAGQIATGLVAIAQIGIGNGPRPVRPRPPPLDLRPRRPPGRRLLQGPRHAPPRALTPQCEGPTRGHLPRLCSVARVPILSTAKARSHRARRSSCSS